MTIKFYLSNISPLWPIAKQKAMIDEKYPGTRTDENT
jgi:hypothetical protein